MASNVIRDDKPAAGMLIKQIHSTNLYEVEWNTGVENDILFALYIMTPSGQFRIVIFLPAQEERRRNIHGNIRVRTMISATSRTSSDPRWASRNASPAAKLAREKPGRTLQATVLVHEAYLRLVDGNHVNGWDSRGHFFAVAVDSEESRF